MASKGLLKLKWEKLSGRKSTILTRTEQYAQWTLPHVFPTNDSADTEQRQALNSAGAEAVNHLSNKIADTLFNPKSPFFRVVMDQEAYDEIVDSGAMKNTDLDEALLNAEQSAIQWLERKGLRVGATVASKLLVITGNCLFYLNQDDKDIQVYTLRDYCIERNIDGQPKHIMTRDNKTWGTLDKALQTKVREADPETKYEDDTEVRIYTHMDYDYSTKRVKVTQGVDNFDLEDTLQDYPVDKSPWIPLTWHLNRGDHYGRGLVEDYAGDFHALDVLSESNIRGLAIMADIKFFVRPGDTVDIEELNKSETGSYHYASPDSIWVPNIGKQADFDMIQQAISGYERRIGRAFLMNSLVTRDAERVTAQEIQLQANELDTSQGGIYSHLSHKWQRFLAIIALDEVGIDVGKDFEPQIITGLSSLSRANDTTQFRFVIEDAAQFNAVPEDMRRNIDFDKAWQFLSTNRGLDYTKFLKPVEQVQQEEQAAREAAMAEEARLKGMDVAGEQLSNQTQGESVG